jgi:WhiB family transcriptional regulator, redox-sensing transcriptional regulator
MGLYLGNQPTISPHGHGPEVTRIRGHSFFLDCPPLVRISAISPSDQEAGEQDMSEPTVPDEQAPELPCHVSDPDLWFADSPSDLERAKALCADCPIRRACLADALDRAEPWGVWGGEILDRGFIVNRKRPRGRPRKEPVAA